MQFSEKLKWLRASKGVSQAELAEKIFVSRSAVAKWENGLGLPSEESLRLIAKYFGVDISEIISDPVTENVIVNQNSTLSKQKIWIISLSAVALIALILVVVLSILFSSSEQPTVPTEPVVTQQLIFNTERSTDTTSIVSYPDDEISADKAFADSRTFELIHSSANICLPELFVKTTADGRSSYEHIKWNKADISCSDNLSVDEFWVGTEILNVYIYNKDYTVKSLVGWVNIKYADLIVSAKVFLNPISVESVTLRLNDNTATIGLAQSKWLRYDVLPYDASYKNCSCTIERITKPNGELYDGDLTTYANIEKDYLTATERIAIGSTIYISAETDYDKVRSNVIAVTVERVAVESLYFGDYFSAFRAGESKLLTLSARPQDASFNVLGEQATVTLMTPNLATIEQTEEGYLITASSEYNAVDNKIYIYIETPEGVSKTFSWDLFGVNVQSVTLIDTDTGEEAEEVIYMHRNGTKRFSSIVAPVNATYDKVHYGIYCEVNNFGRYVSITDDGVLTISSIAPFGLEIYVSCTAGRGQSKPYKIIVEQILVEAVTLKCDVDASDIPLKQVLCMSVVCSPIDADTTSIKYCLVEEAEGVYISGNLLLVSAEAVVGTQFSVYAVVDGVKSNVLTFTVVAATQ